VTFKYVNTLENVADLVTKGISFKTFQSKSSFYFKGPRWLSNDFSKWPRHELLSISPRFSQIVQVSVEVISPPVFDISKYSDLNKVIKIASYLFKFYKNAKHLNIVPERHALLFLIKSMQLRCFPNEIEFLNKKTGNIPKLVDQLDLFLDGSGVIRSKGRIDKSLYFDYNVLNPILLDKNDHLTALIIRNAHSAVSHLGLQATLGYVRNSGFWIPKARQSVKRVLGLCIICKRYNNLAFKYPRLTNISSPSMNLVKPFLNTGLDYYGPVWIKKDDGSSINKMYCLIFTCLNVRAIHLELVPDLTAKHFLLAFKRFCDVHLIPNAIYSDNARTFTKGGDVLSQSLVSEEFTDHLKVNMIKHIKIPLYAAWIGSSWERLIRVVKNCTYKTINKNKLSYFEMLTLLSQIKLAVNSRPLTYRSSGGELDIITPNSFIKMHSNSALVLKTDDDVWIDESSRDTLQNTLERQDEAFEYFRKIWHETYLVSLREHSRQLHQSPWENRIKIGDIVLIRHPSKPRPFWQMGRVLDVVEGPDGIIRSVYLKQADGIKINHSIKNLFPLELSVTHNPRFREDETNEDKECSGGDEKDNTEVTARPPRKAALACSRFIRAHLDDL
jgi:hypothetical protein